MDEEKRTIGEVLDDLVYMVSELNCHAQFLKSRGLSVQFSVNGCDYGDTVSLRIEGEPKNEES
jgi:hypothetical protein